MKRTSILICATVLVASAVFGQGLPQNKTHVVNMTGGTYSWTNAYTVPWQLKSVGLALPITNANTFTVTQVTSHDDITEASAVVTTNAFGNLETNTWNVVTHDVTYLTNTLLSVSTTNDVTFNAYDEDDGLPKSWFWRNNDVLTFALSGVTNETFVIFNIGP